MKLEPKGNCPLNNFEPCKELECAWFMRVAGMNTRTGENMDQWGCAVPWIPILLVENTQQQKGTSSAVEAFRNEMLRANEMNHKLMYMSLQSQNSNQPLIMDNQS